MIEVRTANETTKFREVIKSLPPLANVRGLKYDEICVHFSFNILIKMKRYNPVVWSWYVLAGEKDSYEKWKFWGLIKKNRTDFDEFHLGELQAIAESWNSDLVLDTRPEFTPLSEVMEKLGLKWYSNDR